LAADDAAARRAPVLAYEFAEPDPDRVGDFPLGAYHGVDVPSFFDTTDPGSCTPPPPTGARNALADKLIGYWIRFARTGSPGPDWPAYRHGPVLSPDVDHATRYAWCTNTTASSGNTTMTATEGRRDDRPSSTISSTGAMTT
jgi:carboxylesterase type B